MVLSIAAGIAGGALLATAFLGTLRLSVGYSQAAARPTLWLGASALLRIAFVAAGFVLIARFAGPLAVGAAFVTFVVVRTLVVGHVLATIENETGERL